MRTIDYPDLTVAPVNSLAELRPQARLDMADPLAASRAEPLAAAPDGGGAEPADYQRLLATRPVDRSAPPKLPSAGRLRPRAGVSDLGVIELIAAYAEGSTTPLDVLAALRVRWSDADLTGGAILAVIDGLDAAAEASSRRWRDGTARPLEGVFFGVKDIIDVAGAPVTAGSRTTGERRATTDATAVARLRAAGAIPAVITATTEFACGAPNNARYGAVRNPWAGDRWTGGSSTGSAGALAARLIPFALGTDTGGSIRVPSALCGLTGIKPTYGLVPRTGVASLSWSLDHVGPMARCADDLRVLLGVLAGPDGADPSAAPAAAATVVAERLGTPRARTADQPLSGLRIGVPTSWFTDVCDAAVLAAWDSSVEHLRRLGATTAPVDIGAAALIHDEFGIVLISELAANQEAALDRFDLFDIGTQVRIARGTVPRAVDYLRALRRRTAATRDVLAAFDAAGVDLLVTPGVGATAPRLSDATMSINGIRHPLQSVIGRNTGLFDYLGMPAVMTPAGLDDGLPVGVQIVGRPWFDDAALHLAQALQSVTDHHELRAHD